MEKEGNPLDIRGPRKRHRDDISTDLAGMTLVGALGKAFDAVSRTGASNWRYS
jgi:hypothetical protein